MKATSEFLFRAFLSIIGDFPSVHDIAGFRKTFQNHRRLSKTRESQAATRKSEQALRRRLLDGFSEASRNSNIYFSKKEDQYVQTTCTHTKSTDSKFRTLKKMFSRHYILWKFTHFAIAAYKPQEHFCATSSVYIVD